MFCIEIDMYVGGSKLQSLNLSLMHLRIEITVWLDVKVVSQAIAYHHVQLIEMDCRR